MKSEELIIRLVNGKSIRVGPGEAYKWGSYVRVCSRAGKEIAYWDKKEWEEDPESVMGAIFGCAE